MHTLFERYKIDLLLFAIVFLVLTAVFFGFRELETRAGDIEGDPNHSFPVYGQDAPNYLLLAEHLLQGKGFTLDGETPEVFRTPGYPFMLSIGEGLFGNPAGTSLIVILIAALLAVLVYRVA